MKADQEIRFGRWQEALVDIPDNSVRLILTSPPCDVARDPYGSTEPVDFDELAAFAQRVLMPGGVLAIVIDGPVTKGEQSALPYEVLVRWSKLPGWHLSQVLAYGRKGAPGEYKGRFRRDHEPLLVFVRDGASLVCNKEYVAQRLPSDEASEPPSKRKRREKHHRGSLWWYGRVANDPSLTTGHPAAFAESFAVDAVAVWSNPGDVVCDPFVGSGTVAKACFDLGRKFVGAEHVRDYYRMATDRLRTAIESANQGRESFKILFEFGSDPHDR